MIEFLVVNFSRYLNRRVFVMMAPYTQCCDEPTLLMALKSSGYGNAAKTEITKVTVLLHLHNLRKRIFWRVRPTKTQISLCIRAVWLDSSLSVWRNVASLAIQNAPGKDSDQTARMRTLTWIFAGRTCPKERFHTFRLKWSTHFLIRSLMSVIFLPTDSN